MLARFRHRVHSFAVICRGLAWNTRNDAPRLSRDKSASHIAFDLRSRGLDADLTHAAIAETETTDAERARHLARRKRLGPWRMAARAENRDKDIVRLCRAGFSPGLAKSVIDAPMPDPDSEDAT
jgi:regulatory protein